MREGIVKKYSDYGAIFEALKARETFRGNSATGIRIDGPLPEGCKLEPRNYYTVYSYTTRIFEYSLDTHTVTYFDEKYYSVTTSRLQNLLREAYKDELADYIVSKSCVTCTIDRTKCPCEIAHIPRNSAECGAWQNV